MKSIQTLKTALGIAMLAASQFLAPAAGATVIDFEGAGDWNELTADGMSLQGYRLSSGGTELAFVIAGTEDNAGLSGNGSARVVTFNGTSINMAALDGRAFDLLGFDGGESWLGDEHFWATHISVVGTLAGGGTVAQLFELDLVRHHESGMQAFTLDAGFRNLQSVTFSGFGGNPEFTIDNIAVTAAAAVPEPVSGALLLLGAAGIAASRRRSRK